MTYRLDMGFISSEDHSYIVNLLNQEGIQFTSVVLSG